MIKFNLKKEPTKLDEEIDAVLNQMQSIDATSEDYEKITKNLGKLYELKAMNDKRSKVSPDTLAVILGNLAGIVLILSYEQTHVITSKALGFVIKGRV